MTLADTQFCRIKGSGGAWSQGGGRRTFSHLTYGGYIRDSQFYPKSIVKFLLEDPKISERAINSLQNSTRFRKNFLKLSPLMTYLSVLTENNLTLEIFSLNTEVSRSAKKFDSKISAGRPLIHSA